MKKLFYLIIMLAGVCTVIGGKPLLADQQGESSVSARVGHPAPNFSLIDLNGKRFELAEVLKDKGTTVVVLEWFNPDCPFCRRNNKDRTVINLVKELESKGVRVFGINSTHSMPAAQTKEKTKDWNLNYPILMDTDGKVGKSYGAKSTPHLFVINGDGMLVYDGAIDNQQSGDQYVNYVKLALEQTLAGETVVTSKTKPYGCPVKYKK